MGRGFPAATSHSHMYPFRPGQAMTRLSGDHAGDPYSQERCPPIVRATLPPATSIILAVKSLPTVVRN